MFKRILPTAVAISAGLLVLLGAFIPVDPLPQIRAVLIDWAMFVGAFAFILAYLQLLRVHLTRLRRGGKGKSTSLWVVLSALVVFVLVLWQGPAGAVGQTLLRGLLAPGQSALLALTAITLLLSGMRLFKVRRSLGSVLFLAVVLVMLIGSIPLAIVPYQGAMGTVVGVADWLQRVPALAGMRGLALGVALGILLTGLRVLFGMTRPHSDD